MNDASSSANDLVPMGTWIRIDGGRDIGVVVGFTYLDQEAGMSALGFEVRDGKIDSSARTIIRSPSLFLWRALEKAEIETFALEPMLERVIKAYGPQPPPGTMWGVWRHHPSMEGRFLPDYPDDLQVLVHDGGPRVSSKAPEAVWVRVNGIDGDLFQGRILNQPQQLQSVKYGQEIRFLVVEGAQFPVMVTPKYLSERGSWEIQPCGKCGFSELFDAPSDLLRATFPKMSADAVTDMFTAICPLCHGMQLVKAKAGFLEAQEKDTAEKAAKRPRWQFWRRD